MHPLIIANWKANFTKSDAISWLKFFANYKGQEFVICSPFTLLEFLSEFVKEEKLPIQIGAQDLSAYSEGPYTGEVAAREIKEFAEYVLVGHSERRRLFNETQEEITNKLSEAERNKLKAVLCISEIEQLEGIVGRDGMIIALEPTESIGSDNPSDPKKVAQMVKQIKAKIEAPVLYGGSVDHQNVAEYTKNPNIDGVLVGGESLMPQDFIKLLKNA